MPLISILQFPLWVEPSWAWCSPREKGYGDCYPALCSQRLLLFLMCVVFLTIRPAQVCSATCWCSFSLSQSATSLLSREVLQNWAVTLGCTRMLPPCWRFVSDERWNSKVWNNHSLWCYWRISLSQWEKKKQSSLFTHAQSIISLYYQKNLHFGLREKLYFQNVTVFRRGCNLFCFGFFCLFVWLVGLVFFLFWFGFFGVFFQCQYLCICRWK